ncbi:T9SS type A sorting domain-containing protein [Flavobacterium sp.]|uniref:T9SS type A sorting domain-containing protein n=1 Tax=Flavobacterium sp. TaxID=239 RepID=UPI002633F694|nr:T9SS type A sorting domain-containing protein [Flavobacterium sp.]
MIRNLLSTLALIVLLTAFNTSSVYAQDDTDEDVPPAAANPKVRLGFYAHSGFYRQILMGFNYPTATDAIDPGLDAVNTFDLPNDMYFYTQNSELFIQGVNTFDSTKSYAIGIQVDTAGENVIKFEGTENFPASQTFYIYDAETQTFFNLKTGNLIVDLEAGTYNNRFFLTFQTQNVLGIDDVTTKNTASLVFAAASAELNINIPTGLNENTTISIFDLSGRVVKNTKIQSNNETINLSGLTAGTYIATLKNGNEQKVLKFVKR